VDLVAANDLGTTDGIAYVLNYDSVYGQYEKPIETTTNCITSAMEILGRRLGIKKATMTAYMSTRPAS
jgi:glyceraldehyde-3-phosphate dehydrogenase/erythrose-4-phosphate dehydrogenase